MCTSADSTMTIGGKPSNSPYQKAAGANQDELDYLNKLVFSAPAAAPDATSADAQAAYDAQKRSLLAQRGRNSTFLDGAALDAGSPGGKTLLGS